MQRTCARLAHVKGIGSLQFTFLGTASGAHVFHGRCGLFSHDPFAASPTPRRNVTSACLRADDDVMIFDCGEGTQHQLIRGGMVRQGRIKARDEVARRDLEWLR